MPQAASLKFGIAFASEHRDWAGGTRYFQNLVHALQYVDNGNTLTIYILYVKGLNREYFQKTYPSVSHYYEIPPAPFRERWFSSQLRRLPKIERLPLESSNSRLARHLNLDVLLALNDLDLTYRVPYLYWLPDMQHIRLPDYFSQREIDKRNFLFRLAADSASSVIVSSQAAASEFERWYPEHPCRISIQPFAAQIETDVFERDPSWVCDKYHLPIRFFFLPNQFWKHKNHQVVVQALHLLSKNGKDIRVVCSGDLTDYRHPEYFSDLIRSVSEVGIREQIVFLGTVPREDLSALMRQSIAIIQPSFFEGWSTTVEEVKSLGKRIILSDIPVHREQNPPAAIYFDPTSAAHLAEIMSQIFSVVSPGPDITLEKQARDTYPERLKQFGMSYLELLRQCAKND